jgi:hypothetical protein
MTKQQRQKNKLTLESHVKNIMMLASDEQLTTMAVGCLPKRTFTTRNERQTALLLYFIEQLFP